MLKKLMFIFHMYNYGKLVQKHRELLSDFNRLVDKHNELVGRYNNQTDKIKELQLGLDYSSRVAIAAFKRIPMEYQAEMRNDIEFLDIAIREGQEYGK